MQFELYDSPMGFQSTIKWREPVYAELVDQDLCAYESYSIMAHFIYEMMTNFRKHYLESKVKKVDICTKCRSKPKEFNDCDTCHIEYLHILDLICEAFGTIVRTGGEWHNIDVSDEATKTNIDGLIHKIKEESKNTQLGLKYFAKYFNTFWL